MKYWNLLITEQKAQLYIYGDITSLPWEESDVTAYELVQQIDGLDVDTIEVFINSYGGEVKEGMAICNALYRNRAKVTTICDGFACSAAANIFMAGDERLMNESSMLFIHNAWTLAVGDADDMDQAAADLRKMSAIVRDAYAGKLSISLDELENMLKQETFIAPAEAVDMGFATGIIPARQQAASQSARKAVLARMTAAKLESRTVEVTVMDLTELKAELEGIRGQLQALAAAGKPQTPEGPVSFKKRLMAMRKEN